MSSRRGRILLCLVLAALLVAAALIVEVRLASVHYDGSVRSGGHGQRADHPPYRGRLDLAVDPGDLDEARVRAALLAGLEASFGAGNVHVLPPPRLGQPVTRPLLVVRISGSAGPWWPWGAEADLHVSSLAVDSPDAPPWPWPPGGGLNAAYNRLPENTAFSEQDLKVSVTGFLSPRAFEEDLIERATRPVVASLVDYSEREAAVPRGPEPASASPLGVDWARPFALRCGGQESPFEVRMDHGARVREYEPPFVQDQACDWSFTLTNRADVPIELVDLPAPAFRVPDIVTFGEVRCQAAGEAAGACAGRHLEPGASLGVQVSMRFDACERYPAGGGISPSLEQAAVADVDGERRSLALPWSTRLTLTRPPDSACPARFPLPATRAAIATWLVRTLDPAHLAGASITAADVDFRDDVFDYMSVIGDDRLASFLVKLPDHSCVGAARFHRAPAGWIGQPRRPGKPLFTETLLGQAARCVPDTQVAAEGGAGLRLLLRGEDGKELQVAVGMARDPQVARVELTGTDKPYRLGEVHDGMFTFADLQGAHGDLPAWRLILWPAGVDRTPSGLLQLRPVELED